MHKWIGSVTVAAALLGFTAGCTMRDEDVVDVEQDRLGAEPVVERESFMERRPELIGGEDLADQEFYGTVTELEGERLTVLDENGVALTLDTDADTEFVSRGEPVNRTLLQEGAQVRVAYDELGGQYEADVVEVFPAAPLTPADLPSEE